MKTAQVQTRCECQAKLEATVSESGTVVHGTVQKGRGDPELAPATAMGAGAEQFRVGWLCPMCGRNTLRSFYKGALVFTEAPVGAKAS